MSTFLSDDKEYLKKLSRQESQILAAFMAVAYWEYLLALNPEFAKHQVGKERTNKLRKNPLYVAAEDFLAFNIQDFFVALVKECPEYMAERTPELTRFGYRLQNIWEQVRNTDPNMPELIFPIYEQTIKK